MCLVEKQPLIETSIALADAARDISLSYFRNEALSIENKDAAGFDPVTQADREIEAKLREMLAELRPDDGIYGEEYDVKEGRSGITWIIDPIDGTRAFMAGQPSWATLIGVRDANDLVYGLVDQPFLNERFMGGWGSAIVSRGQSQKPLKTRKVDRLSEAILYSTFPEVGTPEERAGFERVRDQVKLTRYGMDAYAYGMLAAGYIDIVIEAGLKLYDYAAPAALVRAAGGVVTNWQGGALDDSGQVIALANPDLLDDVLRHLNGA